MLRRLYKWCVDAASRPYATWLMGFVSFIESSFFPIPPDAMLIPMSLARPDKAWFYAHVCTLTSVAGGVLGYFIGAVLYESVGAWLIQLYGYGDKVEACDRAIEMNLLAKAHVEAAMAQVPAAITPEGELIPSE